MNSPINVAGGSKTDLRMPPELGEHNGLVLGDLLDYSESELKELVADGVIGEFS